MDNDNDTQIEYKINLNKKCFEDLCNAATVERNRKGKKFTGEWIKEFAVKILEVEGMVELQGITTRLNEDAKRQDAFYFISHAQCKFSYNC